MSDSTRKRCLVAYATRDRQFLWHVDLAGDATVEDALVAARQLAVHGPVTPEDVPWDTAPVGIFGEVCKRSDVPAEGDRIEIYRPLSADPKERRRERVRRARRAARGSGG